MKNLQVGDNDLFGRRFNGHDLQSYLRQRGIDAEHLVWTKRSDDPHTHQLGAELDGRLELTQRLTQVERTYAAQSQLYPNSYGLLFHPLFLGADVVHYHLIHNYFFNLAHLPILSRLKPTVWTLHDPWALTGHCVHPFDCERWRQGCGECPNLGSHFALTRDTTALNWEIKRLAYQQSDLDVVVSSRWMLDKAKNSPLLERARLHRIPFGIDLARFAPQDPAPIRARLGIPADNVVVAFRAVQNYALKGMAHLLDCLERLQAKVPVTLLVFQEPGLVDHLRPRYQVIDLGLIFDEARMVEAYNAADLFLMPSSAESFGMMAMEAMACGRPSIVMSGTALEEVVHAEAGGGIVVPQGDRAAFLAAVQALVDQPERRRELGTAARRLAQQHYDKDRYVSEIIAVYTEAIARHSADARAAYIIAQLQRLEPLPAVPVPPAEAPPESQSALELYGRIRQNRLARWLYRTFIKRFLH